MSTVNIVTYTSNFEVNIDETTSIEDLIIETCKHFTIGPIARHLFALRIKDTRIWVHLNAIVKKIPHTDFEFRIRFNVPDVNRLSEIDAIAYDFYFNQVKYEVLHTLLPPSLYKVFKSEIMGLSVVDMYRAMVEEGQREDKVIDDYKKYIPKIVLRRHFFFLKKPVVKNFNVLKKNRLKNDPIYVKSGYLEQFKGIFPNYLSETFKAFIKNGDEPCAIQITVDPFSNIHSGISMKYDHKDKSEHVCTIDDLCYLNIRKEGTVEISRKNGIPLYLQFNSTSDMMSFVSLLDGYYRLTVKWIFNLCRDLPTPSLQKLLPLKCHGPISGKFAYDKLEEKRNNKVGCYILRESDLKYGDYYIDVCTKTSTKPVTYKIETTNNKLYRLCNNVATYDSIPALIAAHKSDSADFILRECLPPSEFDQSNLLICQTESCASAPKSRLKKDSSMTHPLCIDARTLMVYRNKPKEGRNQFTTVYRADWSNDNVKRTVAMKVLKETYKDKYLNEFLSLTSRWAFVDSKAVVKFFGLTLSNPVSMVTEYLPLGRLDHYLQNVDNHIPVKEVDLVEAATYLANALWSLEEAGFVHGNIRCRKVLVSSHTDNSFVVRLSDPGLHDGYTDADLHWIPPEYHNDNMNDARNSVAADVWAFGTTLWEIFSYGKSPPLAEAYAIKKFYKCGKNLPHPLKCPSAVYFLMRECWINEADHRKRPQAVMRDINQILYQVYNARQGHAYATIVPSHDSQPDNVSNKSKESDDLSSSLFSELTLTTFVDESEERCSADLLRRSDDNTSDEISPSQSSTRTYQRCENTASSTLSIFSQPNYSIEDNSISSMQSIFELDLEWKLILVGRIGEGFHGEVYRGMLQRLYTEEDTQRVAVKKLKAHALTRDRRDDFDREISIMKKLDHPNIVRIRGIIRDPELCLVLEYVELGSLRTYLNIHRDRLETRVLLKFAFDVAKGMAYLSEKKIVHRDLAARNILVVSDTHVKISDFGLAQFIGNNNYYTFKTERHLPVEWYAPESLEFGKFSPQSDVWSYGVTLYEMFTYGEDPRLPIRQNTVDDMLDAFRNQIRLPCPAHCPPHVYSEIMRECWEYEAPKRPTFRSLTKMLQELFFPDEDPSDSG